MKSDPTFTEVIELHERKWGTTEYPGRPSLDQLLSAYIVVMWKTGKRFFLTIHQDAQEVNDLALAVLTGQVADPWDRRLARIFVSGQPIDFRVRIVTAIPPQGKPVKDMLIPLTKQPEVVPLARQPELVPLPRQPNSKHGEALPGRKAKMLPGRKADIVRTRFKPKTKPKK